VSYGANRTETQITIELGKCATSIKQTGSGRWEFALNNGSPLGVSARLAEDWLLLDVPVSHRLASEGWFDLLRLNSNLNGLCKFVLRPSAAFGSSTNFGVSQRSNRDAYLRGELPVAIDEYEDADYDDEVNGRMIRLQETCLGLKTAYHRFQGEEIFAEQTASSGGLESRNRLDDIRRLCRDAGWPFIERAAGRLMVDLEVKGGFYQAAVEQQGEGVRVAVEISSRAQLGATSRAALSLLLLEIGGRVRLARPSIAQDGDHITACFEVEFTTMPAVVELAHALASLSVACTLSGREALAIQDDLVAKDYLTILGTQTVLPFSSEAAD